MNDGRIGGCLASTFVPRTTIRKGRTLSTILRYRHELNYGLTTLCQMRCWWTTEAGKKTVGPPVLFRPAENEIEEVYVFRWWIAFVFRHALFQFKLDLPHLTTSDILDDTHMIPCSYIVSPFLAFRVCLDIRKPTLRRLLVSYILSCSLFIRGLLNHLGVSLSLSGS